MLNFRYRKNGGEILGASVDTPYPDNTYFGNATDPPTPDGTDFVPAKIWDGVDLRNATQAEVDLFPTREAEDANLIARGQAKELLLGQTSLGKAFRVLIAEMTGAATPAAIDTVLTSLVSRIDSGEAEK